MSKILKPNGIILSDSRLTLNSRKLYNFLIFKARNKLENQRIHTVTLSELYNYMNWTSRNTVYVRDSITALVNTSVTYIPLNKKLKWAITPLLGTVKFFDGYIEYEFTPYMIRKFIIKQNYTLIDMALNSQMTSVGKLAFYEFLEAHKNIKATPFMSTEELKKLCGADKKKAYKDFKQFNYFTIKPMIKDFKSKLGWGVTPEYKKSAGVITHVRFVFRRLSFKERVENARLTGNTNPLL